jgi:protein-tyrosine phosphatase
MNIGKIDVHAHLLPGLDDGCSDNDQSIACAREMTTAGYTHAFCTPHVWPSLPYNTPPAINAAVEKLQKVLDAEGIALKLFPGGEINLLEAWPTIESAKSETIATYGMAGKIALFDFWADTWQECRSSLEAAIANLKSRGIQPILGHPERIGALQKNPAAIDRISELGVLLQLNCYCLAESTDSAMYQTARRLLEADRYFLIGTDTHKPTGMARRMRGLQVAEQIAGKAVIDKLTIENPRKLLESTAWGN